MDGMNAWVPEFSDRYLWGRQALLRKSPLPGVRYPIIPRKPS